MDKFKFLKISVLSLIFFSFSYATEIYYVNVFETINKSKMKGLAETVLKKKADQLAKKYKIDELKGKRQLNADELNRYRAFINGINYYQTKVSDNISKVMAKLMEKFGKKYGYNVIVAEISVIYASPKYDKTEEFIKFVNSEISKNKSKIVKEIGNIR